MKIYINLNSVVEKYYDHNDILEEDPKLAKPYIEKFVDTNEIRTVLSDKTNWVSDKLTYVGQLLYKILYLIVKRNALFSKETLKDKVKSKIDAYREAHRIHDKYIDVYTTFHHMFEVYAATAAMLAGFEHYDHLPLNVRQPLEKVIFEQIGVTG